MLKAAKQFIKNAARLPLELGLKVLLGLRPAGKFNANEVDRILVFAYHGLGNFIMYTPALRLLRERYPSARIDLQVGNNTGCEEVLAESDLFDNIYNVPYNTGLFAWLRRALEIRKIKYDLSINEFHSHSWKLALILTLGSIRFRLGHVTSPGWSRRFSRYSFVFNLPVQMREDEHEIERYLDLVCAAGVERVSLLDARCFIHLSDQDRNFAAEFLREADSRRDGLRIGVQPGTSPTMRWKQWPIERYRELIQRLAIEQPDAQIILFGSPGEVQMIEDLARGLEGIAIAAGKTNVKQAAALIERCDLLVCNDSGLMHMAVAVGTPVVAIYGPTDIRRTAPLGPRHTVIRHELACSPCFRLEGDEQVHLCPHHDCLMTISVDEVIAKVRQTVDQARSDLIALPN